MSNHPVHFPEVAGLVPHTGSMCLLEKILAFDESGVACSATSHRSPENPLRRDGRLPAIAGIEYGAQAIAVHGGLLPGPAGPSGVLAGVRAVQCRVQYLDDEPGPLTIRATRLVVEGTRLLYAFSVEGAKYELVSGRIAVVLGARGLAATGVG